MALNPDQVETHQFGSSLRGYDKQEVRAYLGRIARFMREREGQFQDLKNTPVPEVMVPEPVGMTDEDRFGALGERIAGLLRNAHESAAQIKANAEAEIEERREAFNVELSQTRSETARLLAEAADTRESAAIEAQELRAAAEADALEIRERAEAEGSAVLNEREGEIKAKEAETQKTQEAAMAELADARGQVSLLLEQARAQSEFIRLEADDIIREKIRANIEAAEGRLTVLRNTEEISRERIRLAQDELGSALSRLSAEPAPSLPEGTDQAVLEEAEGRAIEAGYLVGEGPGGDHRETPDAAAGESTGVTGLVDEGVSSDDHEAGPVDEEPVFGAAVNTGDTRAEVDEQVAKANGEDALAQLVREAMQSAVESARTTD